MIDYPPIKRIPRPFNKVDRVKFDHEDCCISFGLLDMYSPHKVYGIRAVFIFDCECHFRYKIQKTMCLTFEQYQKYPQFEDGWLRYKRHLHENERLLMNNFHQPDILFAYL